MKKYLLCSLFVLLAFIVSAFDAFAYRDEETGEFITKDPAGFVDGPNQYTYVKQNPWTNFDPEGLATEIDYKTDQQKAKDWHDQATKDAGGDRWKQKALDETFNKWMAADQQNINKIEATAKKWNDAAKVDVMKALGKTWQTTDDTDYGYKTLESTDPKEFLMDVTFGAGRILDATKADPKLMPNLISVAGVNGVSPKAILSIISMEQRGQYNSSFVLGLKEDAAEAKKWNMDNVSVGPAQLKGPARKAAGLTVQQAETFSGAFQGAAVWLSNKNPSVQPNFNEAQRARAYNGSYGYGVEFQAVRAQIWP